MKHKQFSVFQKRSEDSILIYTKMFFNAMFATITRQEKNCKKRDRKKEIKVKEMSCFCSCCFTTKFQSDAACPGWSIANFKKISLKFQSSRSKYSQRSTSTVQHFPLEMFLMWMIQMRTLASANIMV